MYLQVSRKHDRLQGELERMSSVLPQVAAAASRTKEALEPCRRSMCPRHIGDIFNYDRQVIYLI